MAWYDKREVAAMVARIMEAWERHYDDMLSADAKAAGWGVAYEPPVGGEPFHRMRLVQIRGEDPNDVYFERVFMLLDPRTVRKLVKEMRVSGKWEHGREWHVPAEARLGALMWLNRRDPAISHELPDVTGELWRGPRTSLDRGDYGLELGILYVNWLSAKSLPRRRLLAGCSIAA